MRGRGAAVLAALGLLACGEGAARLPAAEEKPASPANPPPIFADATAEAGLAFRHLNDAGPRRLLPETMGAGVAFVDYDGDGLADLLLVRGGRLAGSAPSRSPEAGGESALVLYRNRGGGRFEEATARAGLAAAGPLYGMGIAAGDLDNDGDLDLFVSGVGRHHLYENLGDGRLAEVGAARGLSARGFGSSAAFLDADRDGWLDLFLGRYVRWSPETDVPCRPDGTRRAYCTPEVYAGETSLLLRNRGGRGFEDVSRAAGLAAQVGKALGVVAADLDGDGWTDLAVANDTVRNFLFWNRGGAFREVGVEVGFAYSESGATRGGMGIDGADLDGDGLTDLVVGNFAQEMAALYRGLPAAADPPLFFVDDAAQAGIGLPTLMPLAFGALALDADGDGRLDLLFANGHIEPEIAALRRGQSYAQPLQLFRNRGEGSFDLVAAGEGDPLAEPLVGRGLATADYDRDGDADVVVTQNGREARLLRNAAPPRRWLRFELAGRAGNATGYGATLRVVAGERTFLRHLASGRSYLSASEPALTIGLGDLESVDRVEVTWPSGLRQVLVRPDLDRGYLLIEPLPPAGGGGDG